MAYEAVFDFTQKAQNEAKASRPLQTPFSEPDPDAEAVSVQDLPARLQAGIQALGWPALMPVQAEALPYILDGQDLVVQSRTGSGKTGAFLLPLLEKLDPDEDTCQALVLCPTRELARQIHDEFQRMNAGLDEADRLRAVPVYGGTAYGPQIEAFEKGAHLVVGTPGRVLDHLSRGTLKLDRLRTIILDEADEMLSMGFFPDMLKVRRYLPRERDSYMFSATMPFQVQRIGQEFLTDPVFIATAGGTVHVERMTHRAAQVAPMEKDRALATLIEWENPSSAIIFANTRRDVEYLATFLNNYGYNAAGISSDLTQKAREKTMKRLRDGDLRFLVATDVAARGIDVEDLSHVFHYDIPQDREYYVHRSGRTARAGKAGVSIAITTASDMPTLRQIAKKYDIPLDEIDLPTPDELGNRVGQRLTRILEDDLRGRSNLERERQKRFVPVARQFVEEGEPELLAMLLDRVYQASLHDTPAGPAMDRTESEYDVQQREAKEAREARDGDRTGRGRDEMRGRSRRRDDDDRPALDDDDAPHADARDDVSARPAREERNGESGGDDRNGERGRGGRSRRSRRDEPAGRGDQPTDRDGDDDRPAPAERGEAQRDDSDDRSARSERGGRSGSRRSGRGGEPEAAAGSRRRPVDEPYAFTAEGGVALAAGADAEFDDAPADDPQGGAADNGEATKPKRKRRRSKKSE
ncbi:DEAD/DEAH box helicase [Rubrivirga sp. S365]|uniref:DEAD/DEAH box helicase n=1 Tax=Rubrivirga sp. S365 TaxID=3076080 RepID=UPI0028C65CB6|nr:DEAD/DEAH box helicase [Rubrivirga sp. S365]MDT7856010.1 DEAD/DEAH box helicase [Rubrivirga sp. S365]